MPALEQQQQQQQRPEPPLCTHQYSSAFGTYRKPTHGEDTLIKTPSSLHVLAISNGHMFSVPVKVRHNIFVTPFHELKCRTNYQPIAPLTRNPSNQTLSPYVARRRQQANRCPPQ